jgi:methanethiol S-methyltransferase
MSAIFSVTYGLLCYVFFLATFAYAVGFVGNLIVPTSIDVGRQASLLEAAIVNLMLLAVFAVQHSVMARRSFKLWWTHFVPEAVERSTYVLAASLALALVLWQWRPIATPVIWQVSHPAGVYALNAVFWLGWAVLLLSTFLIDHFELFGLRQIFSKAAGHAIAAQQFKTPLLYRHVRHPIYLGFLLGFWATPFMTAGHLLFALGATAYIFLGIWFEERDLVAHFGDRYRLYRQQVGMLVPRLGKARSRDAAGH